MMVRLLSVAAALVMVAPAQLYAGDPLKHDSTATSTATVEVRPDGSVAMTARNVRLIPYVAFNPRGEPSYLPRLATVTTDVRTRSDAEGVDPASTVAVTIDDLSTQAPRRLASFTDPGSDGHLVDQRYFASIQFGCCGGVDRHVVHATETGHLLFRSTGEGEMGRVGWVDMPNARPAIVRWAAFDGDVAEGDLARGMLGILAYGGDDGPLATLEVRLKGSQEAIEEKISNCRAAPISYGSTASTKAPSRAIRRATPGRRPRCGSRKARNRPRMSADSHSRSASTVSVSR